MLKKILTSPWTALVTLTLLLAIRIADPAFVESVRLRYFDTLITQKTPTENNIYTVNIDEASLDRYGQWPLPRDEYAKIIENLYQRGAGLVVLNVLMAEPDRTGGDAVLANALQQYPVVLPSVPSAKTKNTPRQPGSAVIGAEYSDLIVQYSGLIANVRSLEASAVGVGIVNTLPEVDGVNRRLPMVVAVNGKLYPSLAMETLRVAAGDSTFQVKMSEIGVEKMRIPAIGPITTDNLGRIWVDLSQQSKSVTLMNLPKDFGGAIVIVGPTAAGIANPIPTANGAVWPQQFQAMAIGTMINGVVIQRPAWADGLELIAILLVGVGLLFLTRHVYVGLACVAVTSVATVAGSYFAYTNFLWLFDITALVGTVVLVSLHAYGVKFVSEFLQKQQIKKQFGTYLSPDLVAQLQRQPELLKLGGTEQELTIMFTDVRGFTSISEHYGRNVQGLTSIMNRYMTAMTKKILENRGTLDKYIGDAQMAFWNAPLDDADHARNAVRTALQMMESLDEFNAEVTAEGIPAFGMGLGINTDTVVVGNMGSDQRFDYTCLGDGVNLAARLEGQSKPYGVKIVLGPKTAQLVKDEYFVLELDCIAVKGKKEGVTIYTVLGHRDKMNIDKGDVQMHEAMLMLYRQQKFDQTIKFCQDLKGRFAGEMDHYYDAWIERCEEMKHVGLPQDWDGVFRATSK
jgi:adenylate cyclase